MADITYLSCEYVMSMGLSSSSMASTKGKSPLPTPFSLSDGATYSQSMLYSSPIKERDTAPTVTSSDTAPMEIPSPSIILSGNTCENNALFDPSIFTKYIFRLFNIILNSAILITLFGKQILYIEKYNTFYFKNNAIIFDICTFVFQNRKI